MKLRNLQSGIVLILAACGSSARTNAQDSAISSGAGTMSTLSRVRPDGFTIAMLATVMLGFLLPCRGTVVQLLERLSPDFAPAGERVRRELESS